MTNPLHDLIAARLAALQASRPKPTDGERTAVFRQFLSGLVYEYARERHPRPACMGEVWAEPKPGQSAGRFLAVRRIFESTPGAAAALDAWWENVRATVDAATYETASNAASAACFGRDKSMVEVEAERALGAAQLAAIGEAERRDLSEAKAHQEASHGHGGPVPRETEADLEERRRRGREAAATAEEAKRARQDDPSIRGSSWMAKG
jgi:hypothetical protein